MVMSLSNKHEHQRIILLFLVVANQVGCDLQVLLPLRSYNQEEVYYLQSVKTVLFKTLKLRVSPVCPLSRKISKVLLVASENWQVDKRV